MSSDKNFVNLTLQLDKGNLNADELDQMTHDLQVRLQAFNIESVDLVREQTSHQGSKAVDPVTIGALTVVVVQALLPKILDFLQAWTLGHQSQKIVMKVNNGNKSVEVDFPETTDPDKIKSYVAMITSEINKGKK